MRRFWDKQTNPLSTWGTVTAVVLAAGGWATGAIADPLYRAEVTSTAPEVLERVQAEVSSDAYVQTKPDGSQVIVAGSFSNQTYAQERVDALRAIGAPGTLATYDVDPSLVAANSSASETTTAPTPSTLDERSFTTLVTPNSGESADQTMGRVQRFFPQANRQSYQGATAIQTGQFSQLSQARLQAHWLREQGFDAVAIPSYELNSGYAVPGESGLGESTTIASSQPVPTQTTSPASTPQASGVWVLVADPVGAQYDALKSIIPDSTPTLYNQQQVVRTGEFPSESEAISQVQFLATQGYEAGIFPAVADTASTPTTTAPSTSTASAPVATAPGPDPTTASEATESPVYWVFVEERLLPDVQAIATDAFVRQWQGQPVVQVGTYRQRPSAETAIQQLSQLGITGRIVEGALST